MEQQQARDVCEKVGAAPLQREPGESSGLGHDTEAPYRADEENSELRMISLFGTSESSAGDDGDHEVCFHSTTSDFDAYLPGEVLRSILAMPYFLARVAYCSCSLPLAVKRQAGKESTCCPGTRTDSLGPVGEGAVEG